MTALRVKVHSSHGKPPESGYVTCSSPLKGKHAIGGISVMADGFLWSFWKRTQRQKFTNQAIYLNNHKRGEKITKKTKNLDCDVVSSRAPTNPAPGGLRCPLEGVTHGLVFLLCLWMWLLSVPEHTCSWQGEGCTDVGHLWHVNMSWVL